MNGLFSQAITSPDIPPTIRQGAFPCVDTTRYSSEGNGLRAGILIPIKKVTIGMNGEYVFNGAGTAGFSRTGIVDSVDSIYNSILRLARLSPCILPRVSVGSPSALFPMAFRRFLKPDFLEFAFVRTADQRHTLLPYLVHNTVSVSGGAQFIPAPNMLMPQYWQIMQYRAGIRYSQLPDGVSSESAVTVGIGLPLLSGGGILDLDAEFGRRTDTRFSGYAENFLTVFGWS